MSSLNRRKFLIASIAFSGFASGLPGLSILPRAWARSGPTPETEIPPALVQMARRLYPYDAIPDEVYAQVLDDVITATAYDEAFIETLRTAEQTLNSQQSSDFFDLDVEHQIKAMQAVEHMSFFAAIHGAVKYRLYNHPAIWRLLDYEGPSYQLGGYLNRGAGDIDWLPEE